MAQACRALCAVFILTLFHNALAQQQPPKGPGAAKHGVAISTAENDLVAPQKKIAVLRAAGFSEQLLALNDVRVKIWAVARLADLLWKEDEPSARQLLSKALDLSSLKNGSTPTDIESAVHMRRDVISIIARHDTSWAQRLIEATNSEHPAETPVAQRMDANFNTAYDLLKTDPHKSIDFADRSLRDGVPPDINSLLILLRLKDERAANRLFLKALDQLLMQPVVSAETLLSLGTYIFTSPEFDPQDPSIAPDTTRVVGVGRLLVYDITADRPNIPREIITAYLQAASKILARHIPVTSRPSYYAAARLLLPKTVKFAPELTQTIAVIMQGLTSDVPPELTLDSAYANFAVTAPKEMSEIIKDIEKEKSEQRRNERYFVLVADLWRRSDFVNARTLNARISDREASADLKTLIDFKEGAEKLKRRREISEVEETARKLPKGIERSLLWLGIARARAKAGESQRSIEAINGALESALSVNDARRPYLTLSAASQLAALDPVRAQTLLVETVRQINGQTAEALASVSWEQRVETGRMWRSFPLEVTNVDCDFRQTLPSLMKADTEGTVEAVKRLTDERQLALALLAAAAAMLK